MSVHRKSPSSRAAGRAVGPVGVADVLGWASSALGAPMLLTPRQFLRAIGVRLDPNAVGWTIAVGVREHLATLNIIAMRQRRIGVWSRVAGDSMDLALLAQAYRHKRDDGTRLLAAAGLVGAIMFMDLVTAVLLTRAEGRTLPTAAAASARGPNTTGPADRAGSRPR